MFRRYLNFPSLLHGGSVKPYWMADGSRFWYADATSGDTVFLMVNPAAGTVTSVGEPDRSSTHSVDEGVKPVARPGEVESPAGGSFALVRDHNLWLRSGSEGESIQVTYDGTADNEWIVRPGDWVRGFWTGTVVRLGKRHDLVVLPGQPHEFEGPSADYSFATLVRYLVHHLNP